jgi:hypothetical protein
MCNTASNYMIIMNHESGKEVATAYFKILPQNLSGRVRKMTKNPTRIASPPTRFNKMHLTYTATLLVINDFIFPCILLNLHHMKIRDVQTEFFKSSQVRTKQY